MKQLRQHQFAVAHSPWLTLWQHEWDALRGLPAWAGWLFMNLLARSDFKSGKGTTGIGELVNALAPDQPERGPRLESPTSDQVQKMLRRFEALGIFARNVKASILKGKIFFEVAPRTREIAAAEKQAAKQAGVEREKTSTKSTDYAHQGAKTGGGTGGVIQRKILKTAREELSTGVARPQEKMDPPRGVDHGSAQADPRPPAQEPAPAVGLEESTVPPRGEDTRPAAAPPEEGRGRAQARAHLEALRAAGAVPPRDEPLKRAKAAGNTGLEGGGARSAVRLFDALPVGEATPAATERETNTG